LQFLKLRSVIKKLDWVTLLMIYEKFKTCKDFNGFL
jgi:hypothetical protein